MDYPLVRPLMSTGYWRQAWWPILCTNFSVVGGLWVAIRIIEYFWPAQEFIHWSVMLLPSLIAVLIHLPMRYIKHRVNRRDVDIEVRVGDILELEGSIVIGTNSTFDTKTEGKLISLESLQGQFTRKFYNNENHLDVDINRSIANEPFTELKDERKGKTKRYQIGTIAELCVSGRMAYMVAITHMNKDGVAQGSWKDITECLGKLWYFIGERGDMTKPVLMPVLGTRYARITQTRTEVICEIIDSFIAACSESTISEKLVIVVSKKDYIEHQIDLGEIDRYLDHVCRYTNFTDRLDAGNGQAVP